MKRTRPSTLYERVTFPGKIYVGVRFPLQREVFRSHLEPTGESHGELYGAVIGPFKTVRAAEFMAQQGGNNPHCQTVDDAERISKEASPCK